MNEYGWTSFHYLIDSGSGDNNSRFDLSEMKWSQVDDGLTNRCSWVLVACVMLLQVQDEGYASDFEECNTFQGMLDCYCLPPDFRPPPPRDSNWVTNIPFYTFLVCFKFCLLLILLNYYSSINLFSFKNCYNLILLLHIIEIDSGNLKSDL